MNGLSYIESIDLPLLVIISWIFASVSLTGVSTSVDLNSSTSDFFDDFISLNNTEAGPLGYARSHKPPDLYISASSRIDVGVTGRSSFDSPDFEESILFLFLDSLLIFFVILLFVLVFLS